MELIKIDRIEKLTATKNQYTIPSDFSPKEFFEGCYGVTKTDAPIEDIRLKAYGVQVKYLRSLPLHYSQIEVETSREHSIFSYNLNPTYDFREVVLSYGSNVEILSPPSFRDEIFSELENSIRKYQK